MLPVVNVAAGFAFFLSLNNQYSEEPWGNGEKKMGR